LENNAIQVLEALEELHAVTPTVHTRELTKNAVLPQVHATNSPDADNPPLNKDSAVPLNSRDLTPDALSQEPPRANATEAEFANKQIHNHLNVFLFCAK